jgi:hypothetical protein
MQNELKGVILMQDGPGEVEVGKLRIDYPLGWLWSLAASSALSQGSAWLVFLCGAYGVMCSGLG